MYLSLQSSTEFFTLTANVIVTKLGLQCLNFITFPCVLSDVSGGGSSGGGGGSRAPEGG